MRQYSRLPKLLASVGLTAILAVGLGGCGTTSDVTGSIPTSSAASSGSTSHGVVEAYGKRYRANPKNPDAAIGYGEALRANGQRAQAVAVLEQASIANPSNKQVLAAWGRALDDNGDFQEAFDVLSRANSPANPDWRILSAQGTALDQLGHHKQARGYYLSALKIVPGEPSVLSNLGLSYLLSKDLPDAEKSLRKAYASPKAGPRVRQNLGLVLGLEGHFDEAKKIVAADLPPDEAAANVAYLKEMLKGQDDSHGPRKTALKAALNRAE
ncbi:MAG: tetratricopeptide repeat protein [Bradyrhizobium sp.]